MLLSLVLLAAGLTMGFAGIAVNFTSPSRGPSLVFDGYRFDGATLVLSYRADGGEVVEVRQVSVTVGGTQAVASFSTDGLAVEVRVAIPASLLAEIYNPVKPSSTLVSVRIDASMLGKGMRVEYTSASSVSVVGRPVEVEYLSTCPGTVVVIRNPTPLPVNATLVVARPPDRPFIRTVEVSAGGHEVVEAPEGRLMVEVVNSFGVGGTVFLGAPGGGLCP